MYLDSGTRSSRMAVATFMIIPRLRIAAEAYPRALAAATASAPATTVTLVGWLSVGRGGVVNFRCLRPRVSRRTRPCRITRAWKSAARRAGGANLTNPTYPYGAPLGRVEHGWRWTAGAKPQHPQPCLSAIAVSCEPFARHLIGGLFLIARRHDA